MADRVFAYVPPDGSWYINNTGFVVGPASVIGALTDIVAYNSGQPLSCFA